MLADVTENKMVDFVPFERGQIYRYVVRSDYMPIYTANEVSKHVFWLTAHLHNSKKVTSYVLGHKSLSAINR